MAGVNKVILLGRLGKDPEIKVFEGGGKICNIVLATSENYTDREGNKVEKTEWHNIVFNDKLADLVNTYLAKGREVYVEGKLRTRKYDDANGVTKYITEILGQNVNFIGGRNDSNSGSQNYSSEQSSEPEQKAVSSPSPADTFTAATDDDDLPF
jgi:single-strand DNA-binding protein